MSITKMRHQEERKEVKRLALTANSFIGWLLSASEFSMQNVRGHYQYYI